MKTQQSRWEHSVVNHHDHDDDHNLTLSNCIPHEICFHIMTFLDMDTLIHKCFLISKSWNVMARKIPLSVLDMGSPIEQAHDRLKLLSNCQQLMNITFMDLSRGREIHDKTDDIFKELATCTTLQNLKVLHACGHLSDIGLQALAQSSYMSNLRELRLLFGNDGITEYGIQILSTSPMMRHLKILYLCDSKISPRGVQHLVQANFKLTELQLPQSDTDAVGSVGNGGAIAIGNSPQMNHLTILNLENNAIEDEGALSLIRSEHMKNLTSLDLSSNLNLSKAVAMLIASTMKHLTHLTLGYTNIGEEGAIAIVTSPHMSNLTFLSLEGLRLGEVFAMKLASSSYCSKLKELHLFYNYLGDSGAQHIASSEYMKNLTSLYLGNNNIGDSGAKSIASSEYMKNLTNLSLCYNHISDDGAMCISSSIYMSNLRMLKMPNFRLTYK
ncbi:hypothetical protein C9374_006543 [Naegleria lovaniensis]|uniref:F-box domain-containing protein n=1 Tax=Naegleria lovaniensis TaxID=51637 RepID=A0AA88GLP2_NAELO|nr:uncharacterized protein C9374_006543 [Naegleria lovaniensis]KAG2379426.1 hypothetical protein C9374_006543 [Naegleria lovaniensis]